jgi:pimeloyl-[acyl-carrier protein] synthase
MATVAADDTGFEGDRALIDDLFSPQGREDPQAVFRGSAQVGCRHAVARQILHSANFGPAQVDDSDFEMFRMFKRWLLVLDGERHRTMRTAFGGQFIPRKVGAYRGPIEAKAGELIDAVAEHGKMDLVRDFARPLPFTVICGVLGVPEERLAWIHDHMLTLGYGFARQREPAFVLAASDAATELQAYFGVLLDQRRREPREDLISALARDLPGDPDTRAHLLANCVFFIEAGHVTTVSLIAGGVLLLLQNPEQMSALVADPAKIAYAVEEMLRMITPTTGVISRAAKDDEIEGCPFHAGEHRWAFLAAANRDPQVFEDPDHFDSARAPNPHLSFSAGKHFCLGAPLARLHGEIAVRILLQRLPGLRLDGEPEWRGSFPLRELESLPVAWATGNRRHAHYNKRTARPAWQ